MDWASSWVGSTSPHKWNKDGRARRTTGGASTTLTSDLCPLPGAHFPYCEEDAGGFRHEGLHRQPGPRPLPRHGPGERGRLRGSRAPTFQRDAEAAVRPEEAELKNRTEEVPQGSCPPLICWRTTGTCTCGRIEASSVEAFLVEFL